MQLQPPPACPQAESAAPGPRVTVRASRGEVARADCPACLVKRKALVDQLRATSMPVVCINAPAGYGKTTLVAQWGAADKRPFAWVSLDRSDNDPVEFITCVALTLNRVEPLGGAVFDALSVRAPDVDASVLPHLGKALAASTRPRVLVLDDIHMLVSEQSLDAVAVLIRHIPPGSQIVLVSRSEPTLPLGRLRAEGALLELGASIWRSGHGAPMPCCGRQAFASIRRASA